MRLKEFLLFKFLDKTGMVKVSQVMVRVRIVVASSDWQNCPQISCRSLSLTELEENPVRQLLAACTGFLDFSENLRKKKSTCFNIFSLKVFFFVFNRHGVTYKLLKLGGEKVDSCFTDCSD